MNVTLEEAKKHLNIESDFTDDDSYITSLILASEDKVAHELCYTSSDSLATAGGGTTIPSSLKQAILLNVGNFYANREEATFVESHALVQGAAYIIRMFRNYSL